MIFVDATLFASSEQLEEYYVKYDSFKRWSNYINNLKIDHIPGNHETMLDNNNVATLASTINLLLEKI